jgi:uncharacterized repeat protein (TIGR03803 family)
MTRLSPWKTICSELLLCAATAIASQAQVFTNLVKFDGYNGGRPLDTVVQGRDGNFYGTTSSGGKNGLGTVFKVTGGGRLTTLYSFTGSAADGSNPWTGLVLGDDGNFYGTTAGGTEASYFGTVFKITPRGRLTTLYTFCAQPNCTDGSHPSAGLVQGTDGNFYGTTEFGGEVCSPSGDTCGTIFRITPGGTLKTLHVFAGAPDGANPKTALIQNTDGDFYGATFYGGAGTGGTIFKVTSGGTLITLNAFNGDNGTNPTALVRAIGGNFYGTTFGGGAYQSGTVFKITKGDTLTTLYSFADFSNPLGLIQATDGDFWDNFLWRCRR